MTNIDYRRQRGTHEPFTATDEQVQRVWLKLYPVERKAKAIAAKKAERFRKMARGEEE